MPDAIYSEPVAWAMTLIRCASYVLAAVVVRNLIWGGRRAR